MHLGFLTVTLLAALMSPVTQAVKSYDTGRGTIYRLSVTQDVALESPFRNHNSLPFLLVGKHPQYPNKRSLLQFENLPSSCPVNRIRWAKMYMFFVYAHKASWHTPRQTPYLTRTLMVHRVLKSWNERQATSAIRYGRTRWSQVYLGLNGQDAEARPQSPPTMIYSYRPRGFVEFDVTRAVRAWKYAPNHGVLVKVVKEYAEGRGLRFASNANSDSKRHAYIHVFCNQQ